MKILVRINETSQWRRVYPACDYSRIFANIAGTTTLTESCIEYIQSLGVTIEVEQETI